MQLLEKLTKEDFWIITINNLIVLTRQYRNWHKGDYAGSSYMQNIRDHQMAENLKWLSEIKYPQEKIIVWAHNYHVSKFAGHYPKNFLNEAKMMGTVFTEDMAPTTKTYIIGFTSYKGTAGRSGKPIYKVQKPKGLENWINKDFNYAFVDFSKFNTLYPFYKDNFYMKCSLNSPYHRNEEGQWNKIFDGVFYIKDTYPCEGQQQAMQ